MVLVAVGFTVPDALRVLLVVAKSSYSCSAFISESMTLDVLLPHPVGSSGQVQISKLCLK